MLNKKLCSAFCALAMSVNILPVFAQDAASFVLENVSTSGSGIVFDFSGNVDESTLDSLIVHNSNGENVDCTKTVDGDKITVDGGNFSLNEAYYIIADKTLTSGGTALDRVYVYDALKGGISDDFNTDSNTSADWETRGYYNWGSKKSNIQNNRLMMANFNFQSEDDVPGMENTKCLTSTSNGIVFSKNYESYTNSGDSVLEFDYYNGVTNSKLTGGVQSYSDVMTTPMRVFLRASDITVDNKTEVKLSAENGGAYIVNIAGDGRTAFLEKWNGTEMNVTTASGTVLVGQENKSNVEIKNYLPGNTVRYRFTTKNTENGVRVLFEAAPYVDGVLGSYESVIDYTDTDNPYTKGTFLFGYRGKMDWGWENGTGTWYSSHFIDNLDFTTFGATENKTVNELAAKINEIDKAQNILDYESQIPTLEAQIADFEKTINFNLGYAEKLEEFGRRVAAAKDAEIQEEIASIKAAVDTAVAEYKDNYKNAITTIEKIEERIANIEKLSGSSFDSEYLKKISDMKAAAAKELPQEVYARFGNKGSITVAFFGGSLTEGGAFYQGMIKNWLSEKTGVAAENITVINAGNGGQGSDWHQFRQYNDVMVYNPDLVLIDINANDVTSLDYVPCESMVRVESIIRKFSSMENPPVVGYIQLPNRQYMIEYLLKKMGYKYYLNGNKVYTLRGEPWISHEPIARYYDMPNINIDKFLADNFCSIGQLPADDNGNPMTVKAVKDACLTLEKANIQTGYYTCGGNNGNIGTKCEAGTEGAIEVITNYNFFDLIYDWDKVEAFTGNKYTRDERLNTWMAFSDDGTHCAWNNNEGNRMWGDIALYLLENDPYAALRMQKMPQKAYTTDMYDAFLPERIELSENKIDELDNLTVDTSNGGMVADTSMYTNHLRTRNGILITGPAKLEYSFRGQTFLMTCRSSDSEKLLKYATMDGKAYSVKDYMVDNLLSNDTDHKLVIDIPANETIGLSEIFTDEDGILDNFAEEGKYVKIDLSSYANAYGAYTDGDAPVYAVQNGLYSVASLPKIQIGWQEDNYRYSSPSASDIKNISASVPYDFTMLDNMRYKCVVPYTSLNISKKGQWKHLSSVDTDSTEYAKTEIDTPDDYYDKLNMLIYTASRNDISGQTATVIYTDGTTDNIEFTVYKNAARADAKPVYNGKEISNIDGSITTSDAYIYEYSYDIPNKEKKVDRIMLSDCGHGNMYRIFGMTLTKVYDDALLDTYFTSGGSTITDLCKYKGQTVNVNYRVSAGTDGTVYTAVYDADNRLIAVSGTPARLIGTDGYMKLLSGTITIPETVSEGYNVKQFLWNDELKPLTK